MSVDRTRHGRQIRLPEIGEAGQERLDASEIVLTGVGDAREVEALYLRRAGVRVVDRAPGKARARAASTVKPAPDAVAERVAGLGVRDLAAREVADGAMRALVALRIVLGIDKATGTDGGARGAKS